MLQKVVLGVFLLWASSVFGSSIYDKDIVVKNQSRDDKVKIVFKEMMQNYEEEYLSGFFSYVSEDRFVQDYMTFFEAIEKDMRVYDILSVDTWIEKITEDGVKRYLYVKWEKRYESATGSSLQTQRGYSRFLFDEINGEYKLIELAGNHFWGGSLPEWREEVPQIAGQEIEVASTQSSEGLPDLSVQNVTYNGGTYDLDFDIVNLGTASVNNIDYSASCGGYGGNYAGVIAPGASVHIQIINAFGCTPGDFVIVDPDLFIDESDESNNQMVIP